MELYERLPYAHHLLPPATLVVLIRRISYRTAQSPGNDIRRASGPNCKTEWAIVGESYELLCLAMIRRGWVVDARYGVAFVLKRWAGRVLRRSWCPPT
jgi:hypothetical protein